MFPLCLLSLYFFSWLQIRFVCSLALNWVRFCQRLANQREKTMCDRSYPGNSTITARQNTRSATERGFQGWKRWTFQKAAIKSEATVAEIHGNTLPKRNVETVQSLLIPGVKADASWKNWDKSGHTTINQVLAELCYRFSNSQHSSWYVMVTLRHHTLKVLDGSFQGAIASGYG